MGEPQHPEAEGKKAERRFSQKQYDMLLRCSEKKDMTEWNEWREAHWNQEILLEAADLRRFNLVNADLHGAHLDGAKLMGADMNGVCLAGAHMQGAFLANASLEKANLRGAYLQAAVFIEANLRTGSLSEAHLEGADMRKASLECANLEDAHLEHAELGVAHLEKTRLGHAHLQQADLTLAFLSGAHLEGAHLEGARLSGTFLKGTKCHMAIVDGATMLLDCSYDRGTDFSGVGLANARCSPGLRSALEANVRRFYWRDWYRTSRYENRVAKLLARILKQPVRLFWGMSDYGQSTARIIATFFGGALLFALVYFFVPGLVAELHLPGAGPGETFLRSCYFSVVTMTTLGFGDMHAAKGSIAGYFLLMLQVILGYVILGALVTRLAVLFRET